MLVFYTLYGQNDNYINSYQTCKIQHNCKHIKIYQIPPLCSVQNKNKCVTGQKNCCSFLLIAGLLHAEWVECKLHKFLPNLKSKQNLFNKHQICISNCKNHQNVSNSPTVQYGKRHQVCDRSGELVLLFSDCWPFTQHTLNGPNDDYTNSYLICKNATSKWNTKFVQIIKMNEISPLCSMENDIKCVTGQENWCSSLLIAGLFTLSIGQIITS